MSERYGPKVLPHMRNQIRHPSPRRGTAISTKSHQYESTYMRRMNSKASSSQQPRSPPTQYQSAYMKKMNEKPAPSIMRNFSHGNNNKDTSRSQKTAKSAPGITNRIPRIDAHQKVPSPRSMGYAFSPAATIDAILCETSNGGNDQNHRTIYNGRSSFSISPPRRSQYPFTHNARDPSPEIRRRPSPERIMINSNSNLAPDNFHFSDVNENRSPSPPSRRSFSISPRRGRKMEPLANSQRTNFENPSGSEIYDERGSPSRYPSKKLPHEMHTTPLGINRVPVGGRHSSQFWTQVSVKASSALLKSGANKKFAEAAQIAIIQAGQDQFDTSQESLNLVASKASLAVLTAGGTHDQAAIATVACLKADDEEVNQGEEIRKKLQRQMSNVAEATADFVQSGVDGSSNAVNKISELASTQFETLKSFGEKSVRTYQQYQKTLILERKQQMKKIQSERFRRNHRDRDRDRDRDRRNLRDESYDDDSYRSQSRSRRRLPKYESDNDSLEFHRRRRGRSQSKKKSASGTFDESRSSYSTSTDSGSTSSSRSSSSSDISRARRSKKRDSQSRKESRRTRSDRSRSRGRNYSGSVSSRGTFET